MSKVKSQVKSEEKIKSCFIVTPIGEYNSEVNQKAFGLIKAVIKPVLEKFNYEPIAASDISNPGSINKQIIMRLYEDELVIANLTGLNPNVMYELAVRHAVKKPIIIMAEKGTKLPFDLADQRCIFYEDNLHGVELAKESLEIFLETVLSDINITNPIYDSINESQVLKIVDSTNDNPTKYVISRMDRIERVVLDISKKLSINPSLDNWKNTTNVPSSNARLRLTYKSLSGDKLSNKIWETLKKLDAMKVGTLLSVNGDFADLTMPIDDFSKLKKIIDDLMDEGFEAETKS